MKKKPKTVQTVYKNHPTSSLQLIFFQSVMHQGSVRVSSQFPQALSGVVLQEPICRLPTTLLGSNTLTHSLFEISSIIFLALSRILDLSSYEADLQPCLFSTTRWNPSHICICLWVWPSWDGKGKFHRQAPAPLNLESQNVASDIFCRKTSLLGDFRKDVRGGSTPAAAAVASTPPIKKTWEREMDGRHEMFHGVVWK